MTSSQLPAWNGKKFTTVGDLSVPVTDLGLIHADAVYDTCAVIQGHAFMLREAWERFSLGKSKYRIHCDVDFDDIKNIAAELISLSGMPKKDYILCMMLTRGSSTSGNPLDLINTDPRLFLFLKPRTNKFSRQSCRVCVSTGVRRVPDVCIDQRFKHFAWNDLTLAHLEACDRGYDAGVLLGIDGTVTEGAGFGIAGYKDQKIFTASKDCLQSTTLKALSVISEQHGWEFQYRDVTVQEMLDADGIILASCSDLTVSVTELDSTVYDPGLYFADHFNQWLMSHRDFFTELI